jgi:hypothetical protein
MTASKTPELFAGRFFFTAEGAAMRVPSPAAGTITNTFMGAISDQHSAGLSKLLDFSGRRLAFHTCLFAS